MSNATFDIRLGSGHPKKASFIVIAVMLLAAWFGFILMLGDAGSFHAGPNEPPLATLLAMLLPPTLFLFLLLNSGIRASVLSIDPVWVTAMQGLRGCSGGITGALHGGPSRRKQGIHTQPLVFQFPCIGSAGLRWCCCVRSSCEGDDPILWSF